MLTCRRTLTKSMRKKGPTMILMVNKASHAQKFLNASSVKKEKKRSILLRVRGNN
ncbi:hypothetical protein HID58_059769, partial [Brassica napus]